MKYILTLITFVLLVGITAKAQTLDTNFKKQWLEIDTLIIKNNLPKTALAKVNKLYEEAVSNGLDAQVIKALLYKLNLQDKVTSADINDVIKTFDIEFAHATNTLQKSILLVLKAASLQTYYNTNWYIRSRSTTANFKKDDITTWSNTDFYTAISNLYTQALQPIKLLQQTNIQQYEAIIILGNTPQLRPTMFDLLANNAIDFYKSSIASNIEASNAFTLNNTMSLASATQFIQHTFNEADTTSRLLRALLLYQQILKFHTSHNDTAALIDADINRITWVHNNAAFTHKDVHYKTVLENITQQYPNHPQAAQAWYLLINMQTVKAKNYLPFGDTTNRYAYVPARQLILERLKAQPTQSEGNSNMQQLLREIEAKQLNTNVESVNVPNLPFRALVKYKNVDTFYYRILSKKLVDDLEEENDYTKFWKDISSLPYINSFIQPLPQTNDYQQHKVEIKINALSAGEYVLLGSDSNNFSDSTSKLLAQEFTVSHLSYIHKDDDYFVLDRETGKPLKGVTVDITTNTYYNGKWRDKKIKTVTTGKDGHFNLTPIDKKNITNGSLSIKLTDGKDVLSSQNDGYYQSQDNTNIVSESNTKFEKENAVINFYLDRAIYRPGQKLLFKGIITTDDATTHTPKLYQTKDSLLVYLKDVNDKKIDSAYLALNNFGSFAGSFMLPSNTLTGQFRLEVNDFESWHSFRVEEYKRPTFYVQLDTLKSTYHLKDTITVTGFAQAFAGNFLNNAQVKYNVQRSVKANFYTWYRGMVPMGGNKQIAEGAIITDGTGKFTIKFPALPDEKEDSALDPIFNFAINATVTDAGGETREANTSLSVGYTSVIVKLNVPGIIEKNNFSTLAVSVQNLAEKTISATLRVKVYLLQSPGRAIHKRYWDRPDVFVMGKDEFIRNFPYDEYENESDSRNWHKTADSTKDTFSTSPLITKYALQHTTFTEGKYLIVASTTDNNGHEVFNVANTEVYDSSSTVVPAYDENFNTTENTTLHPGNKATLLAGSAFDDVYAIYQKDGKNQNSAYSAAAQSYKTLTLNSNKKRVEEPVTEDDRGGFTINYAFIKHNRFYDGSAAFDIPWNNKQLNLQYTSFRNKTEPGSQEQWTIKIKGEDTTKAELLTAMYDASLDEFMPNNWLAPNIWLSRGGGNSWQNANGFFAASSRESYNYVWFSRYTKLYAELMNYNSINFKMRETVVARGTQPILMDKNLLSDLPGVDVDIDGNISAHGETVKRVLVNGKRFFADDSYVAAPMAKFSYDGMSEPKHLKILPILPDSDGDGVTDEFDLEPNTPAGMRVDSHGRSIGAGGTFSTKPDDAIKLRTNFNETAFFFPQVYADSAGNYNIQFTMPESLTKWKWLSLAHTQGLSFGTGEQTIVTQKTLMVQPNMPRFLRESDQIELTARISNVGDTALTGQASLELIDASTGNPVDGLFQNVFPNQYFTAEAGQTTVVKFPVVIPNNYYHPLTYRVIAKTNIYNDGEENTLPVLTNRMLVTESLPLCIKGDTTKHFTFDKLLNTNSETLQTQSLTVEYTANPIWTALQSLPYLMEYPYECAEQTFNRFYGNTLAQYIVQQHPRIKQVFEQWVKDSSALASNLEKNQQLKQVLIEETPWVLDAQNEDQQKKNIALLFNVVAMGNNIESALHKLEDLQQSNGGFAWFKGGYDDRYITQYILTGIGRLLQLHAMPDDQASKMTDIATKALGYLDNEANNEYQQLIHDKVKLTDNNLSQTAIQYLYMRSYFSTVAINNKTAYNYFYQQAMKYWQQQSIYMRGMIALTLLRTNQQDYVVRNIYPSIIENAVATEEKGMYFKDNIWGYYWYQAPIEQQALLIELAQTLASVKTLHSQHDADELKTWLINQKQTTNWPTTKATADACYALLLNSGAQIDSARHVTIQLGSTTINSTEQKTEAGTGYFKQVIQGANVDATMGKVTVDVHSTGTVKNATPSWGAVYWQYLEDMDKITGATTPLTLHKQLFKENNTSTGKVLTPITNDSVLHVGDKVIVRIELKSDRNMEYLHLKDMRAASMEPQNVLSEYKWQDGLGYYESTKDAATDFFIGNLSKGSYVFEYPVYITHVGTFSSGIATIQCMYAPEFASHSEGVKIVVE